MTFKICTNGDELEIAEAVAYLERLGVPRSDLRAVCVGAEVGRPLEITATVMVRLEPKPVTPGPRERA